MKRRRDGARVRCVISLMLTEVTNNRLGPITTWPHIPAWAKKREIKYREVGGRRSTEQEAKKELDLSGVSLYQKPKDALFGVFRFFFVG